MMLCVSRSFEIFRLSAAVTKNIAYFLPRNTNMEQVRQQPIRTADKNSQSVTRGQTNSGLNQLMLTSLAMTCDATIVEQQARNLAKDVATRHSF